MLINFIFIFLGLVGSLILLYGPGFSNEYAAATLITSRPDFDLVITVLDASAGEPIWSTITVEIIRTIIFGICFLTLLALVGEWGEKRVLAFLVMMEVLLVFLAALLVLTGSTAGFNVSSYYTTALCILAAGGADTALALALFMTYFKASGETTLK